MKNYTENSFQNVIHISDFVERITAIVITEDVREYDPTVINCSEEIDYSHYTDEQIMKFTDAEIWEIEDIPTLDRILSLNKERLSPEQIKLLENAFSKRYIIDAEDVKNTLQKIRKCTRVVPVPRFKNTDFMNAYGITENDCRDIVHSLTLSDYVHCTRSSVYKFLGDNLMVFIPHREFRLSNGKILKDFMICIKLDMSMGANYTIAAVSIHDTDKYDTLFCLL